MTVNEIITSKIINSLKNGEVPWRKPWTGVPPMNLFNQIPYSGINRILTTLNEFGSPYYVTARQCKEHGIRWSGSSTPICYWNHVPKKDNPEKDIWYVKYYNVWNIKQCELPDHIKVPQAGNTTFTSIQEAEKWIEQFEIVYGDQDIAYYNSGKDKIFMPLREQFAGAASFYETLFHEAAHATGHKSRLNRKDNYAYEELIAEITAAFLMNKIGMLGAEEETGDKLRKDTFQNIAAYCKSWLSKLEDNPTWIIRASGQAEKAFSYIIGEKKIAMVA